MMKTKQTQVLVGWEKTKAKSSHPSSPAAGFQAGNLCPRTWVERAQLRLNEDQDNDPIPLGYPTQCLLWLF
jgi:hypothetical protein